MRMVGGLLDQLERRPGDGRGERTPVLRRNQRVMFAPEDERRLVDPMQPVFQSRIVHIGRPPEEAEALPIANHDDNQHAPNENLRLQNLWDGVEMFAGVFAGLAK